MNLNNLLLSNQKTEEIIKHLQGNNKNVAIKGLYNSRLSFFVANIFQPLNRDILLITDNMGQLEQLYEDLIRLAGDKVLIYPEIEILPHEQVTLDSPETRERLKVLEELIIKRDEPRLILTTATCLLRKIMPVSIFSKLSRCLRQGQELNLKKLSQDLIKLGYQREDMIEQFGQFSIRGGIVDVFPLSSDKPYRLEFFGDELESIRKFNLDNQRSENNIQKVAITPVKEVIILDEYLRGNLEKLEKDFDQAISALDNPSKTDDLNYLKKKKANVLQHLREANYFPGYEQYLPYYYPNMASILDYLKEDTIILLAQAERVWQGIKSFSQNLQETQLNLLEQGSILPSYAKNFLLVEDLLQNLQPFKRAYTLSQGKGNPLLTDYQDFSFITKGVEPFHGQLELFLKKAKKLLKSGYRIIITLNTENKAKSISKFLQDNGLQAIFTEKEFAREKIVVLASSLGEGFVLEDLKLVVYTEKELIGNPQKKKRQVKNEEEGIKISSVNELSVGDYVVHESHGIAKYIGVETLQIQDQHQDYLLLEYAKGDKLYVPTEKINLVQKYIGADSNSPKLYRLGSNNWKKAKSKVESSVKKMAIGLLDLYAERETVSGYAFSKDTVWQKEFEDSFAYEETPDQLKVTAEVKKDMESKTPMDRLLCGDVGYGKTEVAIRAAFKAVMDEKQTAVLVPTTILAQQHYNTFTERMANYPITIEMISRFKTRKEQLEILKKLAAGKIDIIIGTHRLISKDVVFADLGLLIVDEEQRFGVTHKERLKDFKRNVDVLTLTATPIPRTLHMALVGVRDMSVIETPPKNRYPIRTYIREFDRDLVRDVILKEIKRNGQVYFVHNRVEGIEKKAQMIQKLLPECRLAVAHGQMNEKKLEKLMLDFYNQEYDVLLCTTIIETGLDIPNVNTILINKADHMGLAQLYQLRGRVGRTDRIAYAYLLYEQDRILPEIAEKRLQAIKEFTNLGSGFKIAMRDLEIRGAGNLLGPEQHGHIASIGFSLYCKLLEDAIKDLKGKDKEELEEVEVDLNLDAYLPNKYIFDSQQKIEVYKKIMGLKNEKQIQDISTELVDRFGKPPKAVRNLLDLSRLKIKAREIGIKAIKQENKIVNCYFKDLEQFDHKAIFSLVHKYPNQIKIHTGKQKIIGIRSLNSKESLDFILVVLNDLIELKQKK